MLVVGSWVARHGRGRGAFRWVGARRGIRWVPLHSNPPLEADGDLPPCPRWDCCRFHACGRGMVEDCTAAGRMSSCIKYIVFICAFCAKSPLVRMRSPVQIWVAAPIKALNLNGFKAFILFLRLVGKQRFPTSLFYCFSWYPYMVRLRFSVRRGPRHLVQLTIRWDQICN